MPCSSALALVAVLVLGACSTSTKSYDAGKVEKFLKDSQRGKTGTLAVGDAVCPDDVKLTEGVKFQCTLDVAGQPAPFDVTLTKVDEDPSKINVAPAKALVATDAVVTFIKSQLNQDSSAAEVTCGTAKLVIADPGDTIDCQVSLGGETQDVAVLVKDKKGTVAIKP